MRTTLFALSLGDYYSRAPVILEGDELLACLDPAHQGLMGAMGRALYEIGTVA